ncbi:50S ribosome-binding GTPase [Nocardiopsis sp. EMB25]|uniref:GTPase n=1 Tax=Nocardiopsis sp. EMB25 TaxID=2835867 RepID=UPI002284C9BD|nr:GTPase [Nocardiopsis sp. EMB25]MCY9785144.1 50S ribosome-binding GTPase [Nocardiopsis sp. EMB25]
MTTQWNPARATGETGPSDSGDEVQPTGRSEALGDDQAPRGASASAENGPWRGYTMPVPEHPGRGSGSGPGAGQPLAEAAHDGILGYPDAAPAGEAGEPDAPRRGPGRHARVSAARGGDVPGGDGSGGPDARQAGGPHGDPGDLGDGGDPGGRPEPGEVRDHLAPEGADIADDVAGVGQERSEDAGEGDRERRGARSVAHSRGGRGTRGARGTRGERGRRGVRGAGSARETGILRDGQDEGDDPDGLAGWVGSLAEAAEDAQIAGRTTGAFPVVPKPPEWVPAPGRDGDVAEADRGSAGAVSSEAPEAFDAAEAPVEQRSDGQRSDDRPAVGLAGADQDAPVREEAGEPAPDPRVTAQTGARPVAEQEDGGPLPRRVPGPSAVSGAFRAVGAAESDLAADPGTGLSRAEPAPETSVAEPAAPEADASGVDGADASERTAARGSEDAEGDDEYRPTTHDHWRSAKTVTRAELVERLDALSTLTELGQDDLPEEVVSRSTQLLDHAGARLRLSGEHTVVALAGGTGSGKSSLFNALCGLELSQTGVTRPTTSKAHACVWGHEGADALLSWLGVPTRYRHSRTGVLDAGNSELTGLVLLDLPDHDSVRSMHTAEADRLIGSVDLLVWVLDPQKYADAAVHHRYLARMAGHGAVTVAVLNQVDRVEPDELEELLTDLRRLMETEAGVHPRVITTSTVTGKGIRDLREFLGETVRERRALVDRLVADLDQVVVAFEEFHGEGEIPETVPEPVAERVRSGLAGAAGVRAVADVTETNDVKRGRREVGWPVARMAGKLRKDPLSAVQLDFLRHDGDTGVNGPIDAHSAELETVLGEAADGVSEGMPSLWRRRMRTAALSGSAELPAELGDAVSGAVGAPDQYQPWWRVARSAQYALLAFAGLGLVWAVVALSSWLAGGFTGMVMFDDPVFVGYSGALVAASLLVGWLTGVGCGNLVEVAAVQRREEVERAAGERVAAIARQRVIEPMEAELARYRAFRAAHEVARASS